MKKLLVVHRQEKKARHCNFSDLPFLLDKGDILVLNDSAVLPTRFWGVHETNGQVEVSLIQRKSGSAWEALIRPQGNFSRGQKVYFKDGKLCATLQKQTGYGGWLVSFNKGSRKLLSELKSHAEVNAPFYISRKISLSEYQNVFARKPGSTQCPTAGLHFTKKILNLLKAQGINIGFITLHVGGSVLPLTSRDYSRFSMHPEYFEVSKGLIDKIRAVKKKGKKVIAVGTTVVRALESSSVKRAGIASQAGWAKLTIKPGFRFKVVDGFLTNFHLPSSSHLLLTSAFGGQRAMQHAYQEALNKRYKFLDFGDAMLIL